jgi:hypothetical protein
MIQVLDVHDLDVLSAAKVVRQSLDTIGNKTLIIIHGYGSTTGQYKKLTEIRNIGKSRIKKGQIEISISGPDLNDPKIRAKFDYETISKLQSYVVNSGVTIMKKKSNI